MKKILFLIAIVVAIIVTMSSSVFALDEHFEQIDAKYQENIYEVVTKKDDYGLSYEQDKSQQKQEARQFGKSRNLEYKNTMNLYSIPIDKHYDLYGAYDVFCDDENNEYVYLYNSNTLCGYKAEHVYGESQPKDIAIPDEEAINIAQSQMKKLVPDFSKNYKFLQIKYDEKEGIYIVTYCHYLNNIKTDDQIVVWITANGVFGAYSAFNLNRYDKYENDVFDIQSADKNFKENSKQSEYLLEDKYVSLSEQGEIEMIYSVYDAENFTGITVEVPLNEVK